MLSLIVAGCAPLARNTDSAFQSNRIKVTTAGDGPDVILVPGLADTPRAWDGAVASLPGYRYHLVHIRGFAGLPAEANKTGPLLRPIAAEIIRYVRERGLRRPAIVGHSLGGTLALIIGAQEPDLPSRLMIVDANPFVGTTLFGDDATPEGVRPAAEKERVERAAMTPETAQPVIERTLAGRIKPGRHRARLLQQSLTSDPGVKAQLVYEIQTTDLRSELARITVPMRVLWVHWDKGPFSGRTIEEEDARLRRLYANARTAKLIFVPDAYHFIMQDQPDVFNAELRRFLSAER